MFVDEALTNIVTMNTPLLLLLCCIVVAFATSTAARSAMNVQGDKLEICSTNPLTGYHRSGYCTTDAADHGTHTVCAQVTADFLHYTRERGNDLTTPRPQYRFPGAWVPALPERHAHSISTGLKPGDRWCLCAMRWTQALKAGVAPPVVLQATHAKTLEYTDKSTLQRHALHHTS